MNLLEVRDLKVYYSTANAPVRAVDGVSFDIRYGEYFGLVGESGCGKTTLARAILQLLPNNCEIVGGQIRFMGQNLVGLSDQELRPLRWDHIALIPQSAMNALDPVYRVGDQIIESIQAHEEMGNERARARVTELFDLVGLDPRRMDDYPHQFSGGMRQRVLIAMSLALNPDLIIADEPTTALDVIVKDQILYEMERVQKNLNKSLLLVTHDISVVAENCDRVAVMYAGKIMEYAETDPLLTQPFNPYTLGLKNAFPQLEGKDMHLISIPGVPPNLKSPPPGCRFHTRCAFATEKCVEEEPPLLEVEEGHFSACHYPEYAAEFRELAAEAETWETRDANPSQDPKITAGMPS